MSDLSLVRTYIGDKPVYGVAQAVGDANTVEFLFTNAPIVEDSDKVYISGVLQTGYVVDYDLGKFTLPAPPASGLSVEISASYVLLSDTDIQAITDEEGDVKLAAAACLDLIASSQALLQKKLTMMDFSIDGPALAKSLREHAQIMRDQSEAADAFELTNGEYHPPYPEL